MCFCGVDFYALAFAKCISQVVHGRWVALRHTASKPHNAFGLLFKRFAATYQPAAEIALRYFVTQHASRHEVLCCFFLRFGQVEEAVAEPHEGG